MRPPLNDQPGRLVLGIGGSPRKDGNTDVLLNNIITGVKQAGLDAACLLLRDYHIQPCTGCERCRTDKICTGLHDDMDIFYPKIIQSSGLILVSPVHHYNITAWMKAFIDRLYCFYDFTDERPRGWSSRLACQGRKAVISAVCEQTSHYDMGFTLEAMRRPLQALGYEIVGELAAFGIFERGEILDDPTIRIKAAKLGSDLANSLLE